MKISFKIIKYLFLGFCMVLTVGYLGLYLNLPDALIGLIEAFCGAGFACYLIEKEELFL